MDCSSERSSSPATEDEVQILDETVQVEASSVKGFRIGQFVQYDCNPFADGKSEPRLTAYGRILKTGGAGFLHVQKFFTSRETCLGDFGAASELFSSDQCTDIDEPQVLKVVKVRLPFECDDGGAIDFYCKQRYHPGELSFVSDSLLYGTCKQICVICQERCATKLPFHLKRSMLSNTQPDQLHMDDEQVLQEGSFVVLKKDIVGSRWLSHDSLEEANNPTLSHDDSKFPEMWRLPSKIAANKKPTVHELKTVCRIVSVAVQDCGGPHVRRRAISAEDVTLKVQIFARPSQLGQLVGCPFELVETNEVVKIGGAKIEKVVQVHHSSAHVDLKEWIQHGVYSGKPRFHFAQQFDKKNRTLTATGRCKEKLRRTPPCFLAPPKLSTLDLFSGCGGLADGLEMSGLAECKWAVEKDRDAAAAFQRNFPNSKVFVEDAADWFEKLKSSKAGDGYPVPGTLGLICGGPPCQGFSGMNRHRGNMDAAMKRHCSIVFWLICMYLRPRYILFENVASFVIEKNGLYMQEAVALLLENNYQVRFAVLRAAAYGVPQSRRRTFILAAAKNEILPRFPCETFDLVGNKPSYSIGLQKLKSLSRGPGLYPPATVCDSIGDLEECLLAEGGCAEYGPCQSVLQRKLRAHSAGVTRHQQVHRLTELDKMRCTHIPEGGDWRYLPNKKLLGDGGKILARPLKYLGSGSSKFLVDCKCKHPIKCKRVKRLQTTIPWSLAHTASRNNNWRGAFGRLLWKGQFPTILTNLTPLKGNGRIIHPSSHRYITIREAARAQTFRDDFCFHGDLEAVVKQIGNAVPPILAQAIGCEIKQHLRMKQSKF